MKKVLTLFLAVSLVFGAFAGIAGAAELTTAQKYDAMAEAGIFNGNNANGDRDLDQPMTRAQLAKVITLTLGLTEDAAAANAYKDIVSYHWGKPFIGAAVKAGIMNGFSATAFKPNANMTIEELATVLVRAAKLEEKKDATVDGKVSVWAKGFVAAALEAKLIVPASDYTVNALRAALVDGAYTLYAPKSGAVVVESVKAVGAKKVEVKFNQAIDTAKATVAIKKGTFPVNAAKVTPSEDKKTLTVELSSKLTKGDYAVTVGGVVDTAVTKTITVEDEKVDKIDFTSDKAPLERDVTKNNIVYAGLVVKNQYGEDVTSSYAGSLTLSTGNGTAAVASSGKVTITGTSAFVLDQKLSLSAIYTTSTSSAFNSVVLTVSPSSRVSAIEISKLVNKDSKVLNTAAVQTNFWLEVSAKDQYGNALSATELKEDTMVSVTNPSVITATYNDFATVSSKPVLNLKYGSSGAFGAGTSTVYVISKYNGAKATFDVTVSEVVKVDTFSLTAPDFAVAGEKIEIPFTAVDQYGKEITSASSLAGGFITAPSVAGDPALATKLTFEQDYVKGKAKLVLDTTDRTYADAKTLFITAVTSTGKTVQFNLTVNPNAKPVVIKGVNGVTNALTVNAVTYVDSSKVVVLDQYGREDVAKSFSNYTVQVATSDATNISTSTDSIASGAKATLTGLDESATITLTLKSNAATATVANSEYEFSVKVVSVSDLTGFEVADVAKLFTTTDTDYAKALSVVGLLADGTKVGLKAADFDVVTPNSVVYANGKLLAAPAYFATGEVNKEATDKVTVFGTTGAGFKSVDKKLTISNATPVATTVTLDSDFKVADDKVAVTDAQAHSAATSGTAFADLVVEVVDQYGVDLGNDFKTVQFSNLPSGKTLGTLTSGDTFSVVAVTSNNVIITFNVIVK